MKRWNVLITAPRAESAIKHYIETLGAAGCEVRVRFPVERLQEEELLPLVGDIDGIICGDDHFTSRVLESAPRLKIISKWGTGVDSIDLAAAKRLGVVVCNTPGVFRDPVADTVIGYILLFARQLDRMTESMRSGLWQRRHLVSLRECTLGIVGFGNIGRAVARRAVGFGMQIIASTLDERNDVSSESSHVQLVSLEALLSQSDFVTLHADLRPGNRHLLNAERLRLMKPNSILVNTARGGLVDEDALATALREGRIAGAALDVFRIEPLPPESPLRHIPNVYLAPHNANASPSAADQAHAWSIRNLIDGLPE